MMAIGHTVTYDIRWWHVATCQGLQTERAQVILEYAGVTPLVATRVNQAPPLRSEKLAVTLEDLLSGYYLSKGKLHEGQVPALGGGGKWLIDRLSEGKSWLVYYDI